MIKAKKKKNLLQRMEIKGIIHIYIRENERENNCDTLKNVIEELPEDTSLVVMEECVNNEVDDDNRRNLFE